MHDGTYAQMKEMAKTNTALQRRMTQLESDLEEKSGENVKFAKKLGEIRAVPRIFCLRGQTPQTFTGISRIQTRFLVKHYVRKKK